MKMTLVHAIGLLVISVRGAMDCKAFGCGFPKNVECQELISGSWHLDPCDYGYECNLDTGMCGQPDRSGAATSYLGEACTYQLDCHFGTCRDNICVGQDRDEVCNNDDSCKAGFYCDNGKSTAGKCVGQIAEGKTGCTKDAMCVNTAACVNGTCMKYYSVKPGQTIYCEDNGSGINLACTTGRCKNTSKDQGKCLDALPNKNPSPFSCDSDSDCTSSDSSVDSKCTCSNSTKGNAYCELLTGDPDYRDYITIANSWVQSEAILKCNTKQRFGSSCMKQYWDPKNYYTYMYRKATVDYYPMIQDNDYCVSLMYTYDYWVAYYDYLNNVVNN